MENSPELPTGHRIDLAVAKRRFTRKLREYEKAQTKVENAIITRNRNLKAAQDALDEVNKLKQKGAEK